jgi:type II secretory pathway pseudopilin PulG
MTRCRAPGTQRRSRRRRRGFGLLEALVALVLFSLVGLALFGWINASLDAAARLLAREQVQHAQQLATAWAQTLNPAGRERGEAEPEPGWRVTWEARPLTPWTSGAPLPGGTTTLFRLRLYEVELAVSGPSPGDRRAELARVVVARTAAERVAQHVPGAAPESRP